MIYFFTLVTLCILFHVASFSQQHHVKLQGLFQRLRHTIAVPMIIFQFDSQISSAASNPPNLGECITDVNPQATVISCRILGLDKDGRLQGCRANENCVSTSAKAARKYSSPWRFSVNSGISVESAWERLTDAVASEGLRTLRKDPSAHYLLAAEKDVPKQPSGASLFYEFLLKEEDELVLYRGFVDKTVFLYPLQQPVTDFGAVENKLEKVKQRAGFF